jgi:hypothetical protein
MLTLEELKLQQEQIHKEYLNAVSEGQSDVLLKDIQDRMYEVLKLIYILDQQIV